MAANKQLAVFVDFYIQPDRIEEWSEAHRLVWPQVGKEPRCIYFDVFEDPAEKGHFKLFELWDGVDQEWFEKVQLSKPYEQALWPESKPTWAKEMKIEYMERLGEGCSYRQKLLEGGVSRD